MQEYYTTEVGPSGYQRTHHSPISDYKSRKDLLVAHIEPPRATAMPPCHIELAVKDILSRAGIRSRSHKWSIVEAVTEDFNATNELMGRKVQPHENAKMFLHSLELYLKTQVPSSETPNVPTPGTARQVWTEEGYAYEVVTLDAGRNCGPSQGPVYPTICALGR